MYVVIAIIACTTTAPSSPVASWQQVDCETAGQGLPLPEGALVVSVMGCDLDRCVSDMLAGYAVSLDSAPEVTAWCVAGAGGAVDVVITYIEP